MPPVDAILKALPGLPAGQLKLVGASVTALLGSQHPEEQDERFVHEQMQQTLDEVGAAAMPYPLLTKARYYSAFRLGVPVLMKFMSKHFRPKGQLERIKVMGILLDILVQRMKRRQMPVNVQTMCHQLCNVHLAVDLAFPGYTEANMLRWVVEHYQVGV